MPLVSDSCRKAETSVYTSLKPELFVCKYLVFSVIIAPTFFIASTTNDYVLLETIEIGTICLVTRLARVLGIPDPAAGLRPRWDLEIFATVLPGTALDTPPGLLGDGDEGCLQTAISSSLSEVEGDEASLWDGEACAFRVPSAFMP